MCRSRQVSDTLSCPPTNHLANGRLHSSTWSHGFIQRSRSACSAQNPSRSRSACSCNDRSVTSAFALKSSGGEKVLASEKRFSIAGLLSAIQSASLRQFLFPEAYSSRQVAKPPIHTRPGPAELGPKLCTFSPE